MMYLLTVLLFCIGVVWGNPVKRNPMENPGMFQGDMLGIDFTGDRNAIPHDSQRWPDAVVPYVLHANLSDGWSYLKKAMDHIEETTCIRFVERTDEEDYVSLFHGEGCYAHWGRIGGEQALSLGDGCLFDGTVEHELLHAIGFEHEHNRSDRDNYITIYWDNVEEEWHYAFYKLKPEDNRLLTPFDFDSVMLYGSESFAKSPGLKSMVSKDGRFLAEVYDKKGMSKSDIQRIKLLYNC